VTETVQPLDLPPFALARAAKRAVLARGLSELTAHHAACCPEYRRMLDALFAGATGADEIEALPWLPVRLFKRIDLKSVPQEQILRTLVSSGTTGQAVSRIFLDAPTASAQSRALARISAEFLGKKRMPMVIVDDASFQRDRSKFNARAAGILGFSTLGRDHFYLLGESLDADWTALEAYLAKHAGEPILLFGFTFIVWQYFVEAARAKGLRLRFPAGSVLVHGGGWKRLEDRKVSPEAFKAALDQGFGIGRVHNYYGMVEQVGSIFFECEHGFLHAPSYADVLIRDPETLDVAPHGTSGLIQVLSLLPRSYPGHSLLTEDLGTILGEDDCGCGREGKRFAVHGRLKNVEMRGCSDTRVTPAA
jgi:phenylacetate-coenzyme A ligase PaaK-like adenylate-forming protein